MALQTILGHATPAMTARYAHLSPDFLRREIERTSSPISTKSAHELAQSESSETERVEVSEKSGAGGGS